MSGLDFLNNVDPLNGMEEQGLVTNDDEGVEVPECDFFLTEEHFLQLQQTVDPLRSSDNHGIELYEQTLGFISFVVGQNPTVYQ